MPAPMIPEPTMPTRLMAIDRGYRPVASGGQTAADGESPGSRLPAGTHHRKFTSPRPGGHIAPIPSNTCPPRPPAPNGRAHPATSSWNGSSTSATSADIPPATAAPTKWQTLFRADGIHRLSEADVDTLRPLGLRTIIDLRTPDEIEEHGRFPLDAYAASASYHHQPVLDVIWTPEQIERFGESPTFLVDRYREMLVIGDRALGESLRLFGAGETYPAVFHCAAGKDRTGILAALVLGLLGVPDEVIAEDYALSRDGMVRHDRVGQGELP